jgi:uncharacterized protein (TIRG00374 family)
MLVNKKQQKTERLFTIVFIALSIVLLVVFYIDRVSIAELYMRAELSFLVLAVLFMLLAYSFFSLSFVYAHKIFGINVPLGYQNMVNFISISIGNLMDWGGVVGISMRAGMLQSKGAKVKNVIGASLFQTYFCFLILFLSLPVGMVGLLLNNQVNSSNERVIVSAVVLGLSSAFLTAIVVFWKKCRDFVFKFVSKIFEKLLNKKIEMKLSEFSSTLDFGLREISNKPWDFLAMLFSLLLGWTFGVMIVWSSFAAFGIHVEFPVLITGFSIGMIVTTFAFIPGGFGIQEGSMAGVYALFGIDLHIALLVTLAFRVIYYFIPNFISLALYWISYRGYLVEDDKSQTEK